MGMPMGMQGMPGLPKRNVEMRRRRSPRLGIALTASALWVVLGLAATLAASGGVAQEPPAEPQDRAADSRATDSQGSALEATGPWAPDRAEPGSVEAIAEATTSEEYLPRTVAYVPDSETVPSPTEVLGHLVGAPGELSSVAEIHGYFRTLAAASPRVWMEPVGLTEEGRDLLLVGISSEENLADLDRLAVISRSLADPRRTPREEAEALAAGGKVFYHLIGGLHSVETGSPEMLMELAYRLAVSERPEIRDIRRRLVVLLTPVAEPDGRDRMVEWYERHLEGRSLSWQELREFASPPYWGRYVFHDNNRDGMQRTQALTRAVHEVFHRFHPQVVHDLHESLPLLYISTGHGPYSRAVDPVTINEWTLLAHREAAALQAQGLPGVWVWAFWDGWWPGYLVSVANNHNAVGRFYETFGNVSAETFTRDLSDVRFAGEPVTEVEWYRPWPPGEEVEWSLRNNTNYMQAGVLEALTTASRHADELLLNHWIKARRSLDKGRTEPPHAWVFPPEQRDSARRDHLVNLLREHAIEVHRVSGGDLSLTAMEPADAEDEDRRDDDEQAGEKADETADPAAGEATGDRAREPVILPAGSYVVRMDQPYRNAAVNFLERQRFPEDEPNPPYDDVAWTWPLLFGVEGWTVDDPAVLDLPVVDPQAPAPGPLDGEAESLPHRAAQADLEEEAPAEPVASLEPVTEPVHATGEITGFGDEIFLLEDTGQTSLLTARVLLGEHQVDAAEAPFEAAGRTWPAGSWIVYAPRSAAERLARDLGLSFHAVLTLPDVPRRHIVDLPRLGVVHTWTSTQDAGWARYTLDQARMAYSLVSPDDLRRGGLRDRFDVLLFPNSRGDFRRLVHGIDPAYGPLAYTRTAEYPSHGTPNASPDITGGMGFEGLLELQRFVREGGVLVTLANAGTLAVDGGLVRRVDRVRGELRTPGSELQARVVRRSHPIAYGYREFPSVFRGNGPLWQVEERQRGWVVVQFGAELPEGWKARAEESEPEENGPEAIGSAEVPRAGGAEPGFVEEELPLGETSPEDASGPGEPQEEALEGSAEIAEEPSGPATEAGEEEESAEWDEVPEELVLSGFVPDEDQVTGKPAILDVPVGEGRVILFAFNPLHRHLNHSDFRFVWNVLLHWNDLP